MKCLLDFFPLVLKYIVALGLYRLTAPQYLHAERKVTEHDKEHSPQYQGRVHGVPLCMESAGAHSFALLWVAA